MIGRLTRQVFQIVAPPRDMPPEVIVLGDAPPKIGGKKRNKTKCKAQRLARKINR